MPCPSEEVLVGLVDGRLGSESLNRFHAHLDDCSRCRSLVAVSARRTPDDTVHYCVGQDVSHFRIEGRLGSGGMGIVYRAYDSQLDCAVAIKTLQRLNPGNLLRFKSEFRSLRELAHGNLINLGELFEDQGRWFFSMELVEGIDLLEYVRPGGALDENRLRESMRQLALGLTALHSAGKGHRDLKPSNVLVTKSGRVVILDFGLAENFHDEHAAAAGTLAYMAPEQLANEFGPASDWYSVGVILHEALTARLPFDGTFAQMLADKRNREPTPARVLNASAPSDLAELCAELLRTDPARRPGASEIRHRLGCDAAGPELFGFRDTFVGRAAELEQLEALHASVEREGRGATALVCGASGLGKTALVRRFLRSLSTDVLVLSGRCHEREAVPYKAIDEVADTLSRYLAGLPPDEVKALLPEDAALLARVFPVLLHCEAFAATPVSDELDALEQRTRVFAAFRELLARIARRARLVVSIDDVQWADPDSLAFIHDLLAGSDPPRMLLLLIFRVEEPQPTRIDIATLESRLGRPLTRIAVEAMAPADARQLAASLVDDRTRIDGLAGETLLAQAQGSPLFIEMMMQRPAGEGGGARLEDALFERLKWLDPRARELLELVSLAGGPITQEAAARASGLRADDLAWLTGMLRTHRLISYGGLRRSDMIEPYHDRIREAMASHIDSGKRLDQHRRLALAFESIAHGDAETVAVHFAHAGIRKKAREYFLRAAAEATQVFAFDRGARLYQRALEQTEIDAADRRRDLVRLGDALVNAGRGAEAAQAYLAAANAPPMAEGPPDPDLKRRAADQLLKSGYMGEAAQALAEVLASVNVAVPKTPGGALATLLWRRLRLRWRGLRFDEHLEAAISHDELRRIDTCWSVGTGLVNIDTIGAAGVLALHLQLALRAGEPKRLALALAGEALTHALGGGRDERVVGRLLSDAERLAAGHHDAYGLAWAGLVKAVARIQRGDWRRAHALFERVEAQLDALQGVTFERVNAMFFKLASLFFLGELATLRKLMSIVLADSERRGDRYQGSNARFFYFNSAVWLADDDPGTARREALKGIASWPEDRYTSIHFFHLVAQMSIDLYSGGRAAWERIMAEWSAVTGSFFMRVATPRTLALYQRAQAALAALASGNSSERAHLRRDARWCARKLRSGPVEWGVALAELVDAGLLIDAGKPAEAVAILASAAPKLAALDMSLYAAAAQRRIGELTGGATGMALVADMDARFAREGVRDPKRFTRILLA